MSFDRSSDELFGGGGTQVHPPGEVYAWVMLGLCALPTTGRLCRTHSARRFCVRVPPIVPLHAVPCSSPLAATLVRCTTSDLSAVSVPRLRTDFAVRAIRLHRAAMLCASCSTFRLSFPSFFRSPFRFLALSTRLFREFKESAIYDVR